jgi:hypothetical protein
MPNPVPPEFTDPPTPPLRSDSLNFSARADSFLSWLGSVLISELRAALDWIEEVLADVTTSRETAQQAAATAVDSAAITTADRDAVTTATPIVLAARDVAVVKEASAVAAAAAAAVSEVSAANSAQQAAVSAANAGYADVRSETTVALSVGNKVLTVNAVRAYTVTLPVRLVWSNTVYMQGTIISINGLDVTVAISAVFGAAGNYGSVAQPWIFAVLEGINAPTKTGAGASGEWPISISGIAASASKLATARAIGGVAFDGTADISLPGVNAPGNQSTTGNSASASRLAAARAIGGVAFDGTADISLPGVNAPGNQNTTGTAAAATRLAVARAIGGVAFDGSADISLPGVNAPGNQNTTGTAARANQAAYAAWADQLRSPRRIGGVNFDGTEDIDLPGVNKPGNQDTTGTAAQAVAANRLSTVRKIGGVNFDGTADVVLPGVNAPGNQNTTGQAGSVAAVGSAQVGAAIAGMGYQDVGSYAFLKVSGGCAVGVVVASSTGRLSYSSVAGTSGGVVSAGQVWMAHGAAVNGDCTLFRRVS